MSLKFNLKAPKFDAFVTKRGWIPEIGCFIDIADNVTAS